MSESETQALVRRERRKPLDDIASNVDTARHDQVMIINRDGEVIDRRASTRQLNWYIIPAAIAAGVGGAMLGIGMIPLVIGGALATMAPLLYLSIRWRPLRVVWAQIAAGELDDARSALEALARKPPWRGRPVIEQELGRLSMLQGRTAEGVDHYRTAAELLRARRKYEKNPMFWFARAGHGAGLAILGRIDAAREVRRELEDAPATRLFDINRQYLELRTAFAEDSADTLDEAELYEWAKGILTTNLFGTNLALLAWACDKTGDREMAEHLLSETPERLSGHFIADSDPALHEWVTKSWEAWEIEGELRIP